MSAKTFYGLEDVLAHELKALGTGNIDPGIRTVSFEGDLGFMYKANLCLRTALRIFRLITTFKVFDEKEFYKKVHAVAWSDHFDVEKTFSIATTMDSRVFSNSMFVSQRAKDAIVDKFRQAKEQKPSVNFQQPGVLINIHLFKNTCTVSLDSFGESLHQRGYSIETNIAPINEVLAAGLLRLSGWSGKTDFLDPTCGSGTILIEAAMIAHNIPANINREKFSFTHWKDYDPMLYEKIREAGLKKIRASSHEILGFDKAPSAIRKAQENIGKANLSEFISLARKDFFRTEKPMATKLYMVFNPLLWGKIANRCLHVLWQDR